MSLHSPIVHRVSQTSDPRIVADLRRHRRVQLVLAGRFMRADRNEYPCQTKDLSVGGASIVTDTVAETGERIVAYFDHIGGIEGVITRTFDKGFAFQFKVSAHKREKLAAQITWLINRDAMPEAAGRQAERIGATGRKTKLKLDDGIVIDVDVIDYSATGASLGTSARPVIGEELFAGKFKAVVRRHHDKGIGVQFTEPYALEELKISLG
jgi:PilZ domain